MSDSPIFWGSNGTLQEPDASKDGRAHLTGNPRFVVPIIGRDRVAHGDRVATIIRRVVAAYGHRLPQAYNAQLSDFSDDITELDRPYGSGQHNRPFDRIGPSSRIFAALYSLREADDALRLWLLSGLHYYRTQDSPGIDPFLQHLATTIENGSLGSRSIVRELADNLNGTFAITTEVAEQIVYEIGYTRRSPAREKALTSLLAIHVPTAKTAAISRLVNQKERETDPKGQGEALGPNRLNEIAPSQREEETPTEECEAHPTRPRYQLAQPDPRLRIVGQLIPDIEASLAIEEARILYHSLTSDLPARVATEAGLIDLVLALTLTTARDPASIISALDGIHHPEQDSNLNIELHDSGWISHPAQQIHFARNGCSGTGQSPHKDDIILPHPTGLQYSISTWLRSNTRAGDISESSFEERITYHRLTVPRFTLSRLRKTLPMLIYRVAGHPRPIQLIIGTDGYISDAPLAYYAPTESALGQIYCNALRLADIVVDPKVCSDIRVGAPRAALDARWLRDRISHACDRAQTPLPADHSCEEYIEWYNLLVMDTALRFAAATAHRMSFALPDTRLSHMVRLTDTVGIAYICDKRHIGIDRIATLPRSVLETIDRLLMQMHDVRDELTLIGTEQAKKTIQRLDDAIAGRGPLFVRIGCKNHQPLTVRAPVLEDHVGGDIPITRLRHWFATRAEEMGIPACDIAQQMGHRIDGEPYTYIDADSPLQFAERIGPSLEDYLSDLGLTPVPGIPAPQATISNWPSQTVKSFCREAGSKQHSIPDGPLSKSPPSDEEPVQSVIQPAHLEAYRLSQRLQSVALKYLERLLIEARQPRDSPEVQACCRMLLILWGVSTDYDTSKLILQHGRLVAIPGVPSTAGLLLPHAESVRGVQLLSASQATIARVVISADAPRDISEIETFTVEDASMRSVLGGSASLKSLCLVSSMARQVIVPGRRAAWERGVLPASGPRPDRLLALTSPGCRVRPTHPDPADRPAQNGKPAPSELYANMRQALYGWQQNTRNQGQKQRVVQTARTLYDAVPAGSLPRLVARALLTEIDPPPGPSIRASSMYTYLTAFSDLITAAIDLFQTSPAAPHDTAEVMLLQWLHQRIQNGTTLKPIRWLIRRNRTHAEELPAEVLQFMEEVGESTPSSRRSGDPISRTEYEFLRQTAEPGSPTHSPGRMASQRHIFYLALTTQAFHAIRSGELTHITLADHRVYQGRTITCLHDRPHRPLKGDASTRPVACQTSADEHDEILTTRQTVHGLRAPSHPHQANFIPIGSNLLPDTWTHRYQADFARHAQAAMDLTSGPPFRPHSHRHSYATAANKQLLPDSYVGIELDLSTPHTPFLGDPNVSLRVATRYISRQLGHGHPETTLIHYDHSLPMMTRIPYGEQPIRTRLTAALIDTSESALRKAFSRQMQINDSRTPAIIKLLKLPNLADEYIIDQFPAATPGPPRLVLDAGAPEENAENTNPRLHSLGVVAMAIREGYTVHEIAAVQNRTTAQVASDTKHLRHAGCTLDLDYLHPKTPLRRYSRTEEAQQLFHPLEYLPKQRLFQIVINIIKGADPADCINSFLKTEFGKESVFPKIGKVRKELILIVLYAYASEDLEMQGN